MKIYPRVIGLVMTTLLCLSAMAQPLDEKRAVSMGIVLDTSGSMGYKLARARQLVAEVLKVTGAPDEFALIQTSDRPVVAGGYGSTADALESSLRFMQPKGRSAVLDGIYLGLEVSKAGRNGRKALLVISDGDDNSSRYTEAEILKAVAETGVRVYVVGVGESVPPPALLLRVAQRGGGRYFGVERSSNLPEVAGEIVSAMRAAL